MLHPELQQKTELWLINAKAGVTEKYGANHGKFYSESYDTELDKS